MQAALLLSLILIIADALFIGNALSGDYAPYLSGLACLFFGLALFIPFLSEYNRLDSGMNKMHQKFKTSMKDQDLREAEVEIILPGERQREANTYELGDKKDRRSILFTLIAIGCALLAYDVINFYIIEEGLKTETGPISNF